MKNLIKINLKQKVWLTVILSLVFVLCRPMMQLMTYENTSIYSTKELLLETMESFFLPDVITDFVVVVLAAVSIGIVFFSYLFSKKKVDLYHSVPINRKHLFISNYVSGIIIFVMAQAITFLISVAIAIPNHYMTAISFRNMFICIVFNFVNFLYLYGITICAVMLTGKIIVCIAGVAALSLGVPVVLSLVDYFKNYFYVTFTQCETVIPTLMTKYYWLSPISTYHILIRRVRYAWIEAYFSNIYDVFPALIAPFMMAVIFTVVAFYLYLHRPSEACGSAIAFKKSMPIISIPICVICGFAGTWFMCSSVNRYKNGWIWFGLILGVLLSHFILEVIFNESFKAFLSHKIQLVCTVLITILIVGIFFLDMTGFNKYVPKREEIKSAAVYFGDVDNGLSGIELEDNVEEPGYFTTKYKSALENAFTKQIENDVVIDKIYAVSQVGVSCVDDMIQKKHDESNGDGIYYTTKGAVEEAYADEAIDAMEGYVFADAGLTPENMNSDEIYEHALSWMKDNGVVASDKEFEERILTIQICYTLNNGKKIVRKYDVPVSKVKLAMDEVYKTDEFKKAHFDIYDGIEKEAIYKVDVNNVFDDKVLTLTKEQKDKFLSIYMSELENMTVDTISQLPVGRINAFVKTSERSEEAYSGYYIYKDFKKTLAYIEGFGIDMKGFSDEIDADKIVGVSLTSYDLYKYDREGDSGIYVEGIRYNPVENADAINEIAPHIVNSAMIWSNEVLIASNLKYSNLGVDIVVDAVSDNGVQRSYTVAIKDGKVPERIKKDVAIKIYMDNVMFAE